MRIINILLLFFSFLTVEAKSLNETALESLKNHRNKTNYSIIVLGDSRNRKVIPAEEEGVGDSVLSVIVSSVKKITPPPVFAIHGGDLSLIGKKFELERYANIVGNSKIPWLSVRGNHELYSDSSSIYYNEIIGDTDYVFDIGKIRYIVISSCHPKRIKNKNYSDYFISRKEIIWLDSLLDDAKANGFNPVIFSHVPPCLPPEYGWHCLGDKKSYPKPNIEKSNVKTFLSILKYYNVHLAIFSHIHHYDSFVKDGITFVITGGAGAPRYKEFKRGIPVYHFIKMSIFGGDSLIGYVYSPQGTKIDSIRPIKVYFDSKIKQPSTRFKCIRKNNGFEFKFDSPLVREIIISDILGKTLFDTTFINDSISFPLKRFHFYRYKIKTGNNISKGTFYN